MSKSDREAQSRAFYFKHYIGTSEKGFMKYFNEMEDYRNFVIDFENKYLYGK